MLEPALALFERHKNAIRVVLLVGVLVVAPVAVAEVTTAASSSAPARAVFEGGNGNLHAVTADDTVVDLGVSADTVGRLEPLDSDEYLEAPFVTSGTLKAVDVTGEVQTLVGSGVKTTPIGVGDRDGDGQIAVFYANSNGKLVRYENGSSTKVGGGIGTNGVLGVADYDDDGDRDLVFLGSSSTVKYYDGSVHSTGFSSFGSNNGVGVGTPADFDGDGAVRVPYVGSSGVSVKFLAPNGSTTRTIDVGSVAKSQIGTVAWNGDPQLDILYVDGSSPHNLSVAYLNGTTEVVTDSSGETIAADTAVGVAGAVKPPAPAISNYSVTNPAGRTINVSFDASAELTNVSVELTGAESATLTEADFEQTGTDPYHYEGTYDGGVDGNYTATLVTAEGSDGYDGADGQNATVHVETPHPTVTNTTLVDATNDDGYVADGDEVQVTATVNHSTNLSSVVANASAFGAGNVTLTATETGAYAATFTVDGTAVPDDGRQSVIVVATNEYNHSDTNTTGSVFVDTTPPAADAGQNRTVKEDTEVGFDGDGSTDNGETVRYVWRFGDGTNTTGVTATHTYSDPGTYTVELTVYDAAGHSDTDTKTVEVTDVTDAGDGSGSSDGSTSGSVDTTDTESSTSGTADTESSDTADTTSMESTGDGTTSGERDTSDADDPAFWTNVSTPEPDLVEAAIYNAEVGQQVSLDVPTTNTTAQTGGELAAISVVTNRSGNFSFEIRPTATPPDGSVALGANRSVEAITYFEVGQELSDTAVDRSSSTFVVEREALGSRDPSDVGVYRSDGTEWQRLDATVVERSAATVHYRVRSGNLSTVAVGIRQPAIQLTDVTLRDGTVTVGDTAVVTATLENRGAADGTKRLSFAVDGTVADTRTVLLAANETERVTVAYAFEEPGEYAVSLNGEQTGTVEVKQSRNSTLTERASIEGDYGSLLVVLLVMLIGSIGLREQLG